MPRILISGYYGFGNAGDEAILQAIVEDLRRVEAEVEISVLTADPEGARQLGLEPIPRSAPGPVLKALRSCNLLLSGGGGLIQDSTGINSVIYYLGVCLLARLARRPVMLYCQGFGPVRTGLGRQLTRLANGFQLLTWRDQESADEIRALGVGRPPSRVTADPVLGLEPCAPARISEILAQEGLAADVARMERPAGSGSDVGPLVGVAVRHWPGLDRAALVGGLRRFAEEDKARLLLLPFQPSRDRPLSEELCSQLAPHARLLRADYAPKELMGLLSCLDMVLGMRLHAAIMAAARGIPFLGLAYDPKVERFCQRCGAMSLSLEGLSAEGLHKALFHLLRARAPVRQELQRRIPPMVASLRGAAQAALALARGHDARAALACFEANPAPHA